MSRALRHLCAQSGALNPVLNTTALEMGSQKSSGPLLWKAHRAPISLWVKKATVHPRISRALLSSLRHSPHPLYSLTSQLARPQHISTFPPQDLCTSCSQLLEPLPVNSCLALCSSTPMSPVQWGPHHLSLSTPFPCPFFFFFCLYSSYIKHFPSCFSNFGLSLDIKASAL